MAFRTVKVKEPTIDKRTKPYTCSNATMATKNRKKDTTIIGIDNLVDVVSTWLHHVVSHAVENPQQTTTTINNYILNQRREDIDDDEIYCGIEDMLPVFGNPIDWFRDVYLTTSDTAKTVMKTAERQ